VSSPLCDAWVCVKPRLALPALRGFRYGIPVLGFYRSHTLYHCYGVARSPHDGLSASNRVCWNVVVPTPKQGPVRTDLTPRDKNECLAVAQALNEQARKLSQQSRQGVPREYTRVASDLGQSCGKEDFNKAWISIEWMNGCLDNFNKDGRVGLLFKKRRLHLRNWFRVRRLFAATVRHSQ
jgi:hypothetical protein